MLIDTHCHVHEADYSLSAKEVIERAHENGVNKFICVGTSEESSRLAVEFANQHKEAFAAIGVHPHDSKDGWEAIRKLLKDSSLVTGAAPPRVTRTDKILAIGEIGLDYYYDHSPRDVQVKALKAQIELALQNDLPIIFHVRDAYEDFWPIFDSYEGIRGEIHSFTDSNENLQEALKRGLYIGVNGISTFTKDPARQALYASIPLDRLLLETDSPFLTPDPFRGRINQPAFVKYVAEHQAKLRNISIEDVELATTANAHALFAI